MALHIFLCEPSKKQIDFYRAKLNASDLTYHLPYVLLPDDINASSISISASSKKIFQRISDVYEVVNKSDNLLYSRQQKAYLDMFGMYSLRYLYGVGEVLAKNDGQKIFLYSAPGHRRLPLLGIRTLESKHGSRTALGSAIVSNLILEFPHHNLSLIRRSPDILGYSLVRQSVLLCSELLFSIGFAIKRYILLKKLKSKSESSKNTHSKPQFITVVRVPHQIKFLDSLAESMDSNIIVIPLPQARQGNLSEYISALEGLARRNNVFIDRGSESEIINSWMSGIYVFAVNFIKILVKSSFRKSSLLSKHDVNIKASLFEPMYQTSDFVYKAALKQSLNKYPKHIHGFISFAMKGRYAVFEADAARKHGIKSFSIQTAALDQFPSPEFPVFDVFYAQSLSASRGLSAVGVSAAGVIKYSGVPSKVSPLIFEKTIKSIAFFTQPYDQLMTEKFLNELVDISDGLGINIRFKVHPRDSVENYRTVQSRRSVEQWNGTATALMETSDLVLARTSSVLFESFVLGKSSLAVQLSSFDRECSTDFLDIMKREGQVVSDGKSLLNLISDMPRLRTKSERVYKALGLTKDINALSSDLVNEASS